VSRISIGNGDLSLLRIPKKPDDLNPQCSRNRFELVIEDVTLAVLDLCDGCTIELNPQLGKPA
jgi:hypothetical protein